MLEEWFPMMKEKRGGYLLRDVSSCHPNMRAPKFDDSLSWRNRKVPNMSIEDTKLASAANKHDGASLVRNQVCSTNQWPAKVLQQCMKGKREEAERLLKESKTTLAALNPEHNAVMQGNSTRHSSGEFYARKKREEDANMHLGQENSSA